MKYLDPNNIIIPDLEYLQETTRDLELEKKAMALASLKTLPQMSKR